MHVVTMESIFSNTATANVIALFALLVAGGAFALELRRWVEGGPRLSLSIMADATMFPVDDGKRRMLLTVANIGGMPTQVTHMIAFAYPTPFHRIFATPLHRIFGWKPEFGGFINNPQAAPQFAVPYRLDIGDRWMGMMLWDDDLLKWRAQGHLYVGVHTSHSNKRFLKKVSRELPKLDEVGKSGASPSEPPAPLNRS
jgi:hypothetical protein